MKRLIRMYSDSGYLCEQNIDFFTLKHADKLAQISLLSEEVEIIRKYFSMQVFQDNYGVGCTICNSHFRAGDMQTMIFCRHIFHMQCLVRLLKEMLACPVCRAPIRKDLLKNYQMTVMSRQV